MGINELMALKAEYERERIFVEAKISVVNDIIARTTEVAREETHETCETDEPCETLSY